MPRSSADVLRAQDLQYTAQNCVCMQSELDFVLQSARRITWNLNPRLCLPPLVQQWSVNLDPQQAFENRSNQH